MKSCLINRSKKNIQNPNPLLYLALPSGLEELVDGPRLHVLPEDLDVFVPVRPLVLVDQAQGVEELVGHRAEGLRIGGSCKTRKFSIIMLSKVLICFDFSLFKRI